MCTTTAYSLEVFVARTTPVRHDVFYVTLRVVESTGPTGGATCRRLVTHYLEDVTVGRRCVHRTVAMLTCPCPVASLAVLGAVFRIAVCTRTRRVSLEQPATLRKCCGICHQTPRKIKQRLFMQSALLFGSESSI